MSGSRLLSSRSKVSVNDENVLVTESMNHLSVYIEYVVREEEIEYVKWCHMLYRRGFLVASNTVCESEN